MFSVVFGVLLLMLSAMLAWRVSDTHLDKAARRTVYVASAFVAANGGISVLLNQHVISGLPGGLKITLYAMLGASLSFAFVFLLLDLALLLVSSGALACFSNPPTRDAEDSPAAEEMDDDDEGTDEDAVFGGPRLGQASGVTSVYQVALTVVGCVVTGLLFGVLFGVHDVEDPASQHHYWRAVGYGIGAASGALFGFLNGRAVQVATAAEARRERRVSEQDLDDFGVVATGF